MPQVSSSYNSVVRTLWDHRLLTHEKLSAVVDDDFVVDLPARQLARGNFVKVPYLIGSNTDEGSSWVPREITWPYFPTVKINTTHELLTRIAAFTHINSTVAKGIDMLYPANSTDQVLATYLNDLPDKMGLQYKRLVTFLTDYMIVAQTRFAVQSWARFGTPSAKPPSFPSSHCQLTQTRYSAFTYRWNVIVSGMPRYMGATHSAGIAYVLRDFKGWDYDVDPFLDKPQSYRDLAEVMSKAFATFIATGDPNLPGGGMIPLLTSPSKRKRQVTDIAHECSQRYSLAPVHQREATELRVRCECDELRRG